MALPIAGMCDVATAPTIVATLTPSASQQHFIKCREGNTALLRAQLLNAETENAGPLRQVIDVSSLAQQREYIPLLQRPTLLVRQPEPAAIGVFIERIRVAVRSFVEGETHFVELISL